MEQALQLFLDYASAFEETFRDDDWSRLAALFSPDASYEIRGGPLACAMQGREAIFKGLKKSLDGFDRRSDERVLSITDGPHVRTVVGGREVSIDWLVNYSFGDSPVLDLPGRTAVTIAGDQIVAMRDEYDEAALGPVADWLQQYGAGLDGSYV